MTVIILSGIQKRSVVERFNVLGQSITTIADYYGCSTATVRRVLQEVGIVPASRARKPKEPPTNNNETKKIMSLLYRYGISYDHLEVILNAPALTANNVVDFLKKANPAQLAIILHHAGLAKTLPVMPTKPIPKDAQQPLFPEPE